MENGVFMRKEFGSSKMKTIISLLLGALTLIEDLTKEIQNCKHIYTQLAPASTIGLKRNGMMLKKNVRG